MPVFIRKPVTSPDIGTDIQYLFPVRIKQKSGHVTASRNRQVSVFIFDVFHSTLSCKTMIILFNNNLTEVLLSTTYYNAILTKGICFKRSLDIGDLFFAKGNSTLFNRSSSFGTACNKSCLY